MNIFTFLISMPGWFAIYIALKHNTDALDLHVVLLQYTGEGWPLAALVHILVAQHLALLGQTVLAHCQLTHERGLPVDLGTDRRQLILQRIGRAQHVLEGLHAGLALDVEAGVDGEAQVGEAGGEEGHAVAEVEHAGLGDDALHQLDVVGVAAGLLGDEDVGLGHLEGSRQGLLGTLRVGNGLGRVEIVQDQAGFGAGELQNVL